MKKSKVIPWYKTREGKAFKKRMKSQEKLFKAMDTREYRMAAAARFIAYMEKREPIYDDGKNDKTAWHEHLDRKYC